MIESWSCNDGEYVGKCKNCSARFKYDSKPQLIDEISFLLEHALAAAERGHNRMALNQYANAVRLLEIVEEDARRMKALIETFKQALAKAYEEEGDVGLVA